MTELKNCPFCGSEPELGLHGPLVDGEPRIAIWCVSGKCPMDDVGGNNFDTEDAAIKAWNTRADTEDDAQLNARKEKIFGLLRDFRYKDTEEEG